MLIRGILHIIAVLMILVGISQLILPLWWSDQALALISSSRIYIFAIAAIIFGIMLIFAAKQGLIGLRTFMYILGLIVVIFGIVYLANPGIAQSMTRALFENKSINYRIGVVAVSGLIRIILGTIIIYALSRPPARESI